MKITARTWIVLILAAILAGWSWFFLAFPQLCFLDLSVDRSRALNIAKNYLQHELRVDTSQYRTAAIFVAASPSDIYLQNAIGFKEELAFFKRYDYELFFWKIRFFRELEQEEYRLLLSSATGEVTDYIHIIKQNAARKDEGKAAAQARAEEFLRKKFNYDLKRDFAFHGEFATKHDHRTDYAFSWERKDVNVLWSDDPQKGGAKLVTTVQVSGEEILSFFKQTLKLPDEFSRSLAKQQVVGESLGIVFRVIFLALFITTVFFVALRRNNLVMHNVKKFGIGITAGIFILILISNLNHIQITLFHYPTTLSLKTYLWQNFSNVMIDIFMSSLTLLLPFLAGESLRQETFPQRPEGGFLHYLNSSFRSRSVSRCLILGYLVAIVMLGLQSLIFHLGQKYLGVWMEYTWLSSLSANLVPFFAALSIGLIAAFTEEIFYRIFGISLGKKVLKSTVAAVILSSAIWGYGHSAYPVYPMWFRGIEVGTLGIFLSVIYLRYGIIPVLTAHYLFDVFWYSAAYLFGKTTPENFYSSLIILMLPLLWAGWAWIVNRSDQERPLRWHLNRHQIFNLQVIKNYLLSTKALEGEKPAKVSEAIISHGWDPAVVQMAIADLKKESQAELFSNTDVVK